MGNREGSLSYTTRFVKLIEKMNSIGGFMLDKPDVKILVNNMFGQAYIHGLNSNYDKKKADALDKDLLEYPKLQLDHARQMVIKWTQLQEVVRKDVFGSKDTPSDIIANVANTDDRDISPTTRDKHTAASVAKAVKAAVANERKQAASRADGNGNRGTEERVPKCRHCGDKADPPHWTSKCPKKSKVKSGK